MTIFSMYTAAVIPAKAGIQEGREVDSRLRGSDGRLVQTILRFRPVRVKEAKQ